MWVHQDAALNSTQKFAYGWNSLGDPGAETHRSARCQLCPKYAANTEAKFQGVRERVLEL